MTVKMPVLTSNFSLRLAESPTPAVFTVVSLSRICDAMEIGAPFVAKLFECPLFSLASGLA